ncbi:MAG TPA: ATP-binding protein [Jatrophihabitans sp.]|uniref:ATP-binding protein n=1 Tax=Jatrophihabitans sp. TaxID=1932789 RepID=UPI002F07CDC1
MTRQKPASRLQSLAVRVADGNFVLDLSGLSWLDPLHLVGVASIAQLAAARGFRLRLSGLRANQAGYASRMHLGAIVEHFGGSHDLPVKERELDRSDSLLEVTELATGGDVRKLSALVYDRVAGHDAEIAHALHTALAEIGANVCEHSGTVGFMAAQTLPSQGVLRFAVADAGVGLLGTLASQGAEDDRMAVTMALSGTSRKEGPGHGTGLPTAVTVVSRLGGQVLLASGSEVTTANARGRRHAELSSGFVGTMFEGWVPVTGARHSSPTLYDWAR